MHVVAGRVQGQGLWEWAGQVSGHGGPGKPRKELQRALEIEDVIEGLKQVSARTGRGV